MGGPIRLSGGWDFGPGGRGCCVWGTWWWAAGESQADTGEDQGKAEELAQWRPVQAGEVNVGVAGHGLDVDQYSGGGGWQPGGGGVPQPGPAPGDSDSEEDGPSEEER